MLDIDWILQDKIRVTKRDDSYLIESLSTPFRTNVTISYSSVDRMLFNNQDIETEDYMSYVGLLDEVSDRIAMGESPVIIEEENL